ncbi:hypothetical protein AA313_de0205890 [Arthrobotrys entomopaga]|nr:hypothetical protein AA313_de0205890 [Arthrobotrys entomopaga]
MSSFDGPGIYLITSKKNGNVVSRHMIEDRSLNPKYVLCLPKQDWDEPSFFWEIIRSGPDSYAMKNRGATLTDINHDLKAALIEGMGEPMECQIVPTDDGGCTVVKSGEGIAWTVTDHPMMGENAFMMRLEEQNGDINQLFDFQRVEY